MTDEKNLRPSEAQPLKPGEWTEAEKVLRGICYYAEQWEDGDDANPFHALGHVRKLLADHDAAVAPRSGEDQQKPEAVAMAIRLARFEAFGEAIAICEAVGRMRIGKMDAVANVAASIAQDIEDLRCAAKPRELRSEAAQPAPYAAAPDEAIRLRRVADAARDFYEGQVAGAEARDGKSEIRNPVWLALRDALARLNEKHPAPCSAEAPPYVPKVGDIVRATTVIEGAVNAISDTGLSVFVGSDKGGDWYPLFQVERIRERGSLGPHEGVHSGWSGEPVALGVAVPKDVGARPRREEGGPDQSQPPPGASENSRPLPHAAEASHNACAACGKPANYKLFIGRDTFVTVCEGAPACEAKLRAAPNASLAVPDRAEVLYEKVRSAIDEAFYLGMEYAESPQHEAFRNAVDALVAKAGPTPSVAWENGACGARAPSQVYVCTRHLNHDGEHRAWGGRDEPMFEAWPAAGPSSSAAEEEHAKICEQMADDWDASGGASIVSTNLRLAAHHIRWGTR